MNNTGGLTLKLLAIMLVFPLYACGGGDSGKKEVEIDDSVPSASPAPSITPIPSIAPVTVIEVPRLDINDITINWVDRSDNESGYRIERRLEKNETFEVIATLSPNSSSYLDSALEADKTYCYRISAFNQGGETSAEVQCKYVPSMQ